MLGEWALANGKWKKRLAWWLYQHRDLRRATGFHATSELEAIEIRRLGLNQPIVVAPNGLDLPDTLPSPTGPSGKRFLFLSRIHRKKGLLELLNAWRKSSAPKEGWHLRIAGPDDGGYRAVVERRMVELHLESSVSVVGEVTGTTKWELISGSAFFILPSFNENFGIAIAEALACGVPVITTKTTPWECVAEKQAGWWIEHEHEALVKAINEAVKLPSEDWQRRSIAATSIGRSFQWTDVAGKIMAFYESILR
jgi:glycosyltransferase involved in cell wall biosynthesis